MESLIHFGFVLLGLFFLIVGADLLVRGASGIAKSFGVPPLIVGLTIVAYGTSMPEFMASFAAMQKGISGIAIGNVLGSNICNIALVLGIAALLTPVRVEKDVFTHQLPLTIGITVLLMVMFLTGERISRLEGLVLAVGIIVYTFWMFKRNRAEMNLNADQSEESVFEKNRWLAGGFIGLGCIGLFWGGNWVVAGATGLARSFNISERVIGGTLVALGTSLPELITTVVGVLRKQTDLGVGNAVGSCIFNLLMVLGFTAVAKPITGSVGEYWLEFLFCILTMVILWPMARRSLELKRIHGTVLTFLYVVFILLVI